MPTTPVEMPRRRKVLYVQIDGIGDVAVPSLSGCTPLQHAKTPFMDVLAANVRSARCAFVSCNRVPTSSDGRCAP